MLKLIVLPVLLASAALASMVTVTGTGRIVDSRGACSSSFADESFYCSADGAVNETFSSIFYRGTITISNPNPLSSTSCYSGTEFCGLVYVPFTATLRQHSDDSCGNVGLGSSLSFTDFGNHGYGCGVFTVPTDPGTVGGENVGFLIYGQPISLEFALQASTVGPGALGHSDIELNFGSFSVSSTTGTGRVTIAGSPFASTSTPEPGTLLMLGGALVGLIFRRRGSLLRQRGCSMGRQPSNW